ncbi:MAG: polysaccharide biosynthesis/export family protein [Planctomycetota bacterium]
MCAALLVCAACRTPPAPLATYEGPSSFSLEPAPELFYLGAQDVVRVTVAGHPELSTPPDGTPLDERGALHLPIAGAIVLGGSSLAEAQTIATEAFAEHMLDPAVAVALEERRSTRFFVLGQIQHPGPHSMGGPRTALEALGEGGVFLNAADRSRVFLVRPRAGELEVHEFSAETPGVDGLVQVLPGDIVFVRRRGTQRFQEEFLPLLAPWQIALPLAGAAGAFD